MSVLNRLTIIRDDMLDVCEKGIRDEKATMEMRARWGVVYGVIQKTYAVGKNMDTNDHAQRLRDTLHTLGNTLNSGSRIDNEIMRQLGLSFKEKY